MSGHVSAGDRPAPRALLFTGRLRAVAADLWHTFVADPVRENAVRAHGGGSTVRAMVLVGVAAFGVAVVGVVAAPRIAGTPVGPDAVLSFNAVPGLPASVPWYLVPCLMALVMVAAFLGTFGAVLAGRWLALGATVVVAQAEISIAGFLWNLDGSGWLGQVGLAATLLTPVAVLVMRWRRPPLSVVQAVACVLAIAAVAAPFVGAVRAFTTTTVTGGSTTLAVLLESMVGLVGFVVAPAAIVAGTGAVSFGLSVVDFLGRALDTLTGRRQLPFVLVVVALLAWRWVAATRHLVTEESPWRSSAKVVVALVLFGAAVAWWRWATRTFDEADKEVEQGSAVGSVWLAVLLVGPGIAPSVGLVLGTLQSALLPSHQVTTYANSLSADLTTPFASDVWITATSVAIVAWAVWVARRRPSIVAAFAGIAGAVLGLRWYWNVHFADHAWGGLLDRDLAFGALIVVTTASVRAALAWRRTRRFPSPETVLTAFATLALTALLAQSSFLEDPFRPLLGFTGIGLVFFGVVWGFLTAGAHSSATGLAGVGRTTIMLGYAVLTTTLVAWGDATASREFTTGIIDVMAEKGKIVLGTALLLSLMAVWIPILFGRAQRAAREEPTVPEEAPLRSREAPAKRPSV